MPKKHKGNNNTRRTAPKKMPIEYAEDNVAQEYGYITEVLGNCHFKITTIGNDIKIASLCGTIKRNGKIKTGDLVLIEPMTDNLEAKYQVIFKYTPDQKKILEKEGRLIQERADAKGVNQTNLLNFKPTRPIQDIAHEYVDAFCRLYEPNAYIDRVQHYYLKMGRPRWQQYVASALGKPALPSWTDIRALAIVIWRQGFLRDTRWRFWSSLLTIARANPRNFEQFLVTLAHNEHFQEYRAVVKLEIEQQLALLPPDPSAGVASDPRELQPA
jgi:initiation factor 1A